MKHTQPPPQQENFPPLFLNSEAAYAKSSTDKMLSEHAEGLREINDEVSKISYKIAARFAELKAENRKLNATLKLRDEMISQQADRIDELEAKLFGNIKKAS